MISAGKGHVIVGGGGSGSRKRSKKRKPPPIERETSSLPSDVVYKILSNLPVKSLLQFRSVSKPWRDIISDLSFGKTHLAQTANLFDRQKLFISLNSSTFYLIDFAFSDAAIANANSCCKINSLSFPLKKYRDSCVFGSCNGLVLLGHKWDNRLVLWNPSIRVHKKFVCPKFSNVGDLAGVCYDSRTDDYKVVFSVINSDGVLGVFSVRNDEFVEVENSGYLVKSCCVTVNGVLHWVGVPKTDLIARVICYFDVGEMKVKEVVLPKYWCHEFRLFAMGGCLCAYYHRHDGKSVVVWKMGEYGVKESWSWFSVEFPDCFLEVSCFGDGADLWFTKGGEFVTTIKDDSVVVFNKRENKFITFPIRRDWSTQKFIAVTFQESLVVPVRENKKARQHSGQSS